ncbi:hypothetical protein PG996_010176 [Apiospora saccharicola]|uniref:Uncharacterized protein n=1 Tax=Apiospora saccharicola TaxID=335842 RepID=A0ABR1UQ93_9PEZI
MAGGARAARPDPEVGDGGRDRRRRLVRRAEEKGVGGRGQAGHEGEGEAGVVVDGCEALSVLHSAGPQALVRLVPAAAAAALLTRPDVAVDGVVALRPAARVLDLRRDDDAGAVGREARGLEPDFGALGEVGDGQCLYPILIRALVAEQQHPAAEPHGDIAVIRGHRQTERLLGPLEWKIIRDKRYKGERRGQSSLISKGQLTPPCRQKTRNKTENGSKRNMRHDGDDPLVPLGDEANIDGLVAVGATGQQRAEVDEPRPLFLEFDPDQCLAVLLPDQQVPPRERERKGQKFGQIRSATRRAVDRVDRFRLRIFDFGL